MHQNVARNPTGVEATLHLVPELKDLSKVGDTGNRQPMSARRWQPPPRYNSGCQGQKQTGFRFNLSRRLDLEFSASTWISNF